MKKIFFSLLTAAFLAAVIFFVYRATREYAELPTVKFSVSRNIIVAVENFKGEPMPLSPLPEKYEKVYVQ